MASFNLDSLSDRLPSACRSRSMIGHLVIKSFNLVSVLVAEVLLNLQGVLPLLRQVLFELFHFLFQLVDILLKRGRFLGEGIVARLQQVSLVGHRQKLGLELSNPDRSSLELGVFVIGTFPFCSLLLGRGLCHLVLHVVELFLEVANVLLEILDCVLGLLQLFALLVRLLELDGSPLRFIPEVFKLVFAVRNYSVPFAQVGLQVLDVVSELLYFVLVMLALVELALEIVNVGLPLIQRLLKLVQFGALVSAGLQHLLSIGFEVALGAGQVLLIPLKFSLHRDLVDLQLGVLLESCLAEARSGLAQCVLEKMNLELETKVLFFDAGAFIPASAQLQSHGRRRNTTAVDLRQCVVQVRLVPRAQIHRCVHARDRRHVVFVNPVEARRGWDGRAILLAMTTRAVPRGRFEQGRELGAADAGGQISSIRQRPSLSRARGSEVYAAGAAVAELLEKVVVLARRLERRLLGDVCKVGGSAEVGRVANIGTRGVERAAEAWLAHGGGRRGVGDAGCRMSDAGRVDLGRVQRW
ncbi:hypothetical protein TOPH_02114 [Tolypocladium ophioglossoides CBS 100239]|uniref:Uncharacterized protein n=1 Tax=Tolypocladium ophioglossoides (strain CBS 100239) TaxID=1163406 RepID=A0A0L0NG86_TOLOC|nr:hypothetical protein TOPH_02114 [Tolypocladium ophioglossoides CBS 100239]